MSFARTLRINFTSEQGRTRCAPRNSEVRQMYYMQNALVRLYHDDEMHARHIAHETEMDHIDRSSPG